MPRVQKECPGRNIGSCCCDKNKAMPVRSASEGNTNFNKSANLIHVNNSNVYRQQEADLEIIPTIWKGQIKTKEK
jgi:hypothetical protein